MKEESDRCILYLAPSTKEPLTNTCHDILIRNHLAIFQEEFKQLLINERDDDLARLYSLCEHVGGALDNLREILEAHVRSKGLMGIQCVAATAVKNPQQYVNAILEVYNRYNKLVCGAFRSDIGFVRAMDTAFSRFVNNNEITNNTGSSSKPSELLGKSYPLKSII